MIFTDPGLARKIQETWSLLQKEIGGMNSIVPGALEVLDARLISTKVHCELY